MNNYDLKCYEKTYKDPKYWDRVELSSQGDRQKVWADCRGLTDSFYNELIARGYLLPFSKT
ncbi:hypothetical protein [Gloeothece verrucosa]|uniref:Uncharacterized protein n=1 Tax=Gloeothece verrucosa (strain PCC 7822) TaxID=497965 RepID=E0UEI0_GLOV7|nr:hypothetical protein [Gloeothece verrucosa]ADN15426.1 hypothetical protein Cyan7822_3480 [Gloeothece verrucosa PCC 7822]